MEDVVLFYGHLVYFTAIWSLLLPFGILYGQFCGNWYIFPRLGMLC
jgi:hypothetical protein